MIVNSVKINQPGREDEWLDIGYALLIGLEAKVAPGAQSKQATIGELLVKAELEGLTVAYEKNNRSYTLRINLMGETPSFTLEEEETPKKML